jgi:ATP-dependent protease ClpP protease subunit
MRRIVVLQIALYACTAPNSFALKFAVRPLGPQWYGQAVFTKFNALFATGSIEKGDANRFSAIISSLGRDMYGNIALAINSPGGDVDEAFKIVQIMDRQEASVYVPDGFLCASACASIIYLSGRFHIVLNGGTIAFHTCGPQTPGPSDPSSFCNQRIVDNAVEHGTSAGLLQALMDQKTLNKLRHQDSSGMLYLGPDVACQYGMCGPPQRELGLAIPSFDCEKARLPSERVICSDRRLARHDYLVMHLYNDMKSHYPIPTKMLTTSQTAFLAKRNRCGDDIQCLVSVMEARYEEMLEAKYTSEAAEICSKPSSRISAEETGLLLRKVLSNLPTKPIYFSLAKQLLSCMGSGSRSGSR